MVGLFVAAAHIARVPQPYTNNNVFKCLLKSINQLVKLLSLQSATRRKTPETRPIFSSGACFPIVHLIVKWLITGSAVALHCCKAHSKINKKMGNLTPCKIVTPKNFNTKLCILDYVGEATHHANFGSNRYSWGFFPYRRNITTLWLFLLTVLSCPVLFFLGNAPRSNRWTDFHALWLKRRVSA